jgi:hypothetical protein
VAIDGTIQAVVEGAEAAELRSAGQPGAAVPAQSIATQPFPTQTFPTQDGAEISGGEAITISAQAESRMPGNLVVNVAISDIDKNPFQTRYVDDDEAWRNWRSRLRRMEWCSRLVRPGTGRALHISTGERRLLASKKAGKTTVPALVRRSAAASRRDDDH